jgi:DNA-binding response OmpR family regulator
MQVETMSDSSKRILVVDDDEEILETVQFALQDQGYEVLLAHDGQEGLMRAERDQPDLILLDIIMPKRSGFAVLERLRQSRIRSPRIIMLTANTDPRHREFAESRGADAFLNKPFDMDELLTTVESLLNNGD